MWGVGVAAAGAMFSSWNWGRGNGYVNVNVNRAVNIDNHFDRNRYTNNNHWQHDAVHRRGVAYHDPQRASNSASIVLAPSSASSFAARLPAGRRPAAPIQPAATPRRTAVPDGAESRQLRGWRPAVGAERHQSRATGQSRGGARPRPAEPRRWPSERPACRWQRRQRRSALSRFLKRFALVVLLVAGPSGMCQA
jgi:hypothetical protein